MPTSDVAATIANRARPHGARLTVLAVALLLIAHAVLAWLAGPSGIETGGDDARYLLLGQALRHFSYVDYWQLGWPAHSLYPPVYPLLLALWSLVAGSGFDAQIVLSILLSVASLGAAYLLASRYLDPRIALVALAALAFNPALVARAGTVASEMPYALWSVLALLALLGPPTTRSAVLAVAFALLAALTRTAGATLVAALALALLLQRRYRSVLWTGVAAAPTLGAWLLWTLIAPGKFVGVSYVADALTTVQRHQGAGLVATLARRLVANGTGYAVSVINTILPYPNIPGTRIDNWVWLLLASAGLAGGMVAAWRRWQPVVLYLLLYAALLLVWPWRMDRFLEPVALLCIPLWLYGLWTIARTARLFRALPVALALCGVVVATGAWYSAGMVKTRLDCGRAPAPPGPNRCLYPAEQDWMAAVRWVRDSTPTDAVVLTAKSGPFYYYAHRETLSFAAATALPPGRLVEYVFGQGGRYIVLTTVTLTERARLAERVAASCRALAVAAEFSPQAYVLRLRDARDVAGPNACAAVAAYQRSVADSAISRRWQ
jgi:hypothetical protein